MLGLGGVVVFLLLWEIATFTGIIDPRFLPPPHDLAGALLALGPNSTFWVALGSTLFGWVAGLAIAVSAGVVLGVVIGSVQFLRRATASTIEFLRPIPSVALIPLMVLMFGADVRATVILVIYAAFWQMLVQMLAGVADVDPVAGDTARSYRFSRMTFVRRVVWPTSLPYFMTGLRLASAVALIIEVTGELVIGSPGIGRMIANAQTSGAYAQMYALVIVAGFIGLAVNTGARALEKRTLRWHPSVRSEVV